MSDRDVWVVIPNWGKFQHYHDRNPTWLKLYVELASRDEWLALTDADRGLLVLLWVEYARSNGRLRAANVPAKDRQRSRKRSFERLKEAGFIELSSSPPARGRAREEGEGEKDNPQPPSQTAKGAPSKNGTGPKLTKRELAKFTGCRFVRGSHGSTFVRDPLGQDRPPNDWPYARPTREEVQTALMEVGT